MVYLEHNTEPQSLYIPKDGRTPKGRLHFKAYSTINLMGFSDEVVDINTSDLYYRISIALMDNIPSGEYEYVLSDEEGILSEGILIIGENDNPITYDNKQEYEQYEE